MSTVLDMAREVGKRTVKGDHKSTGLLGNIFDPLIENLVMLFFCWSKNIAKTLTQDLAEHLNFLL